MRVGGIRQAAISVQPESLISSTLSYPPRSANACDREPACLLLSPNNSRYTHVIAKCVTRAAAAAMGSGTTEGPSAVRPYVSFSRQQTVLSKKLDFHSSMKNIWKHNRNMPGMNSPSALLPSVICC